MVVSPRIHLISPAGSCRPFLDAMGTRTADELLERVGKAVGPRYRVTGHDALIEAGEDESVGGRTDDRERADDLEGALGDDEVAAIVLLRGGAWFSRILPLIDFSALDRRTTPVAVFGFSELTTLVNIVAAKQHATGIYDMGPAFLTYGLKRYITQHHDSSEAGRHATTQWVTERLHPEFDAYFGDVIGMIEGRGTGRRITARLVRGTLGESVSATCVGGNLTVLSTLIGSGFDSVVRPSGHWLLLEDFNDKLERIDRFLAHLTLAGYWDECAGVLLGDFHKGYEDLTASVTALLEYHLPAGPVPVLTTPHVGHVWPMSPLPLRVPLTLERVGGDQFSIAWQPSLLRTAR